MDWYAAVDLYCERTAPGLINEPLNAVSNAAFIIAAIAATRAALRAPAARGDVFLWILIVIVYLIGMGSAAFHTFANRWSLIADVAPITAFIYGYFGFAMCRFFGLGWIGGIGATALFFAASWAFGSAFPQGTLNGSINYLPAFFAVLGLGAMLRVQGSPAAPWLLVGSLVFLASLTFRTIDPAVCGWYAGGTHFVWHLLNAVLLFLLLTAAIRFGTRVEKPVGAPHL
jgi:hypothetical protein